GAASSSSRSSESMTSSSETSSSVSGRTSSSTSTDDVVCSSSVSGLLGPSKSLMSLVVELEDEFAEDIIEGADERSQHHDCDEHDDRVVDGLGLGRPRHLAQLGTNLLEEFARTRALGAGFGTRRRLRSATLARGCTVLGHLTLALEHSLGFSVHRH